MPMQEIMRLKNAEDEETRVSLMLAIHCAPVLSGLKAANLMSVTGREFSQIGYLLEKTDISCRFFQTGTEKGILYLYREKPLFRYLDLEEIRTFLKKYGYAADDLEKLLGCLSDRIRLYSDGKVAFPHEIGIFLEYPLPDVEGFVEHKGKNFAYSGYWKVYHDVQGALQKFRQYDEERERTVRAVISGKRIQDIVA